MKSSENRLKIRCKNNSEKNGSSVIRSFHFELEVVRKYTTERIINTFNNSFELIILTSFQGVIGWAVFKTMDFLIETYFNLHYIL